MSRPRQSMPGGGAPRLQVEYVHAASPAMPLAGDDVLAVLGFGGAPLHDDPRYLRVPLMPHGDAPFRSEEHTSELPSLMRISYAVFCLKKKKPQQYTHNIINKQHN